MIESRFKSLVLWGLIISKVMILVVILLLMDDGAKWTTDDLVMAIGIFLPATLTFYAVIWNHNKELGIWQQEDEMKFKDRIAKSIWVRRAYMIFLLYTSFMIAIILLPEVTGVSVTQAKSGMVAVESGIGVYIGKLISLIWAKREGEPAKEMVQKLVSESDSIED